MNKDHYKLCVFLSLLSFILCLIFPAFYTNENREPNYGIGLLLWGWLGPVDNHFSWYANIFYTLSLIFFKRKISPLFLAIAITLTLSFLIKNKIAVDIGGVKSEITAYGAGYFFWVTSSAMLLLAKIFYDHPQPIKTIVISTRLTFLILFSVFIYNFVFIKNSQLKFELEKNRILQAECKKSISKIYKTKNGVKTELCSSRTSFFLA